MNLYFVDVLDCVDNYNWEVYSIVYILIFSLHIINIEFNIFIAEEWI